MTIGVNGSAGTAGDGYRVVPEPRGPVDDRLRDDPAEWGAHRPPLRRAVADARHRHTQRTKESPDA